MVARPARDHLGMQESLPTVVEVEEEAGHVLVIDLPSSVSLILRDELQRQTRNKQGDVAVCSGLRTPPLERAGRGLIEDHDENRRTDSSPSFLPIPTHPDCPALRLTRVSCPHPLSSLTCQKAQERVVCFRTANRSMASPKRPHENSAELFRD